MAKRQPPSKRPERALTDTAKAIARDRDEAKEKKSDDSQRPDGLKPSLSRSAQSPPPRKVAGPAPSPSNRRPKKV